MLSGLHCDAELTLPKHGPDSQLDFGHGDVQKVRLGRSIFSWMALDCMPVESDTNVGKPRHLRRVTDLHSWDLPAETQHPCSGTVRLLWLETGICLILTPSHREEGAYERLGVFNQEAYKVVRPGGKIDTPKMPKTVQRSSITLV